MSDFSFKTSQDDTITQRESALFSQSNLVISTKLKM